MSRRATLQPRQMAALLWTLVMANRFYSVGRQVQNEMDRCQTTATKRAHQLESGPEIVIEPPRLDPALATHFHCSTAFDIADTIDRVITGLRLVGARAVQKFMHNRRAVIPTKVATCLRIQCRCFSR